MVRAYIGKVNYYDGCNWLFIFEMRDLVGSFSFFLVGCGILDYVISLFQLSVMWLVGAIKHFNPVLGLRTKEEAAMPLICILQNGTNLWRHVYSDIIDEWGFTQSLKIGRWHSRSGLKSIKIDSLEKCRPFGHVRDK